MTSKGKALIWVFLLLSTAALAGCGIDRGGIVDTVGISTPFAGAAVIGPIETINGSQVTVNETSVDTSSAMVTSGSTGVTSSSFRVGQIIVATALPGTNQGDWDNVTLNFNVAGGPVQVADTATSFELFGQQINLANLDSANIEGGSLPISAPAYIAVSGFLRGNGDIDARAVSNYSTQQPALVTGFAQQIDPANFTFIIGNQLFDFSQAQSINTQSGTVEPNSRVHVQIDPATAMTGALSVISVDEVPLLDPALQTGAVISMTAYVTAATSMNSFELAFQPVLTDTNTVFENQPPNSIAVDQLLQIRGTLQSDRTVMADFLRWISIN